MRALPLVLLISRLPQADPLDVILSETVNWWAKYPYVFLNDEPFDANFIK